MELEHLNLALRQRNPLEAADLGLALLRRWHGPIYRVWFATVLPCAVVVFLALWSRPLLAGIILWWLKPVFDRILLKVYAEAIFGQPPRVIEVWRALPRLLRHSGLLAGLTWGRLDMARSFHLPIWQLEGQQGAEARARRQVLDRKTRSGAVWLTFLCVHFTAFLEISFILLPDIFWPREAPEWFDWEALFHGEGGTAAAVLGHLGWLCAETLVEPFYVAAGFTLYLNRRSELEGWDIELGFRRLARRAHASRLGLIAVVGLVGLLLIHSPTDSLAAAPSPAKQAITEVLADPVFGHEKPDWTWRYRDPTPTHDPSEESHVRPWIEALADWIAQAIRGLAYVGAVALIAILVILLYRYRGAWASPPEPARVMPTTLFGLDVRPDSLPRDIAAAARQLLAQGEQVAALSLLYRGALAMLIHVRGVDFQPGDTEGDCQHRIRGYLDRADEHYFVELLAAWSLAAYAQTPPSHARLETLCQDWPSHFAVPPQSAL